MFYERYLSLCNEKGVSPSKAALVNGISKTSVTRWKDGATPNAEILGSLSKYFNVSTDYLLGNSDIKNKPTTGKGDELTQDEIDFLAIVRQLSPESRAALKDFALYQARK